MKRRCLLVLLGVFLIGCIILGVLFYFYMNRSLEIADISFVSYNKEEETYTIEVLQKEDFFIRDYACVATNDQICLMGLSQNNRCELTLPVNKQFAISLTHRDLSSSSYNLLDYMGNVLDFSYAQDVFYLTVNEEVSFSYADVLAYEQDIDYAFSSSNPSVVEVNGTTIKGVGPGEAIISTPYSEKTIQVYVTDLVSTPVFSTTKKTLLPCNRYTLEESEFLDRYLAYKIEKAGVSSRAAAVEAARFLTLSFPYRIPYFYENGRLHSSGVNYVDGEGRYYHTGLYLHSSKFASISHTFSGPAIWGCPLTNWEPKEEIGYPYGAKKPNGLDCSGFVAWVLKNAGFDPGDIGAGNSNYKYEMTDLGDYQRLSRALLSSDKIKAGDLINYSGHIGIIIGIDDTYTYVAESLPHLGGVVASRYTENQLLNTFTHVVFMDAFYVNDGNYQQMW